MKPVRRRRVATASVSSAVALFPHLAAAQGSQALDAPDQVMGTVLTTIGAVIALFVVSSIGYLYLRTRNLEWSFQEKHLPPEPGSGGHN